MGFLAIPSIGLLYYFKTYKKTTVKNFLLANIIVVAILMLVYKFSLTYVLMFFGWGEVFFVNTIGLPFNSGSIIIGVVFIAAFYFGLRYTRRHNYTMANLIVLCLMFLFLGFSSWIMLPIRANAKVVINENNPSDARALLAITTGSNIQVWTVRSLGPITRRCSPNPVRTKTVPPNMKRTIPLENISSSTNIRTPNRATTPNTRVCCPGCGAPSTRRITCDILVPLNFE